MHPAWMSENIQRVEDSRYTGGLVVGIDASRNRSGGAVAHLRGLFSNEDPRVSGILNVHLWAYEALLAQLPDQPWLIKHPVPALNGPIWQQLWWQYATLPKLCDSLGCAILYNTDAGSICPFRPSATLSQDMLSFDPGEMQRYGISKARLRLEILKVVQVRSLRRAELAIFLSEHARQIISQVASQFRNSVVIPHGIDDRFRAVAASRRPWPVSGPVRCLYISNAAPYKHQWHVVEAVSGLRQEGYDIELLFVGGGRGPALKRLTLAMERFDPGRNFVRLEDFVPNERIPDYLSQADLFIFASSCENLPVTLLEAMASGIPICSSDRGPMPEALGENGCYFDPEQPVSISGAIRSMIDKPERRECRRVDSFERSKKYTWQRCAKETWKALADVCHRISNA